MTSIATLADLKQALDITGTNNDAILQRLLDSASLAIERYTGLRFEPNPAFDNQGNDTNSPVTVSVWVSRANGLHQPQGPADSLAREFYGRDRVVVTIPHARTITAVTINDGSTTIQPVASNLTYGYWTETDPRLYDPFVRRLGVVGATTQPIYDVQVTGRFGIVPAPVDIVDAVLTLAARRFREKDALYGDQVQLPDGAVVNYFKQLPATIRSTVDSYCEIGV